MRELKDFLAVNARLVVAVGVALIGLYILQSYIHEGSDECLGVADSKETVVSFETSVVVKRIFVLPGQKVKKGQPLLEVVPVEVNLKLMEVSTELESLESEQKVREALLASVGAKGKDEDSTPIDQMIRGLRSQSEILKNQQSLAIRYAEEDGVVGTVAFRPKEQVPPFMPVITLTPHYPDLVYGFVHENRASEYRLGDIVEVSPTADTNRKTTGKVVSLGSRIVPFPDRFQMIPTRPNYFGREVIIRLAKKNRILIGEKVRVSGAIRSWKPELGFMALADARSSVKSEGIQSDVLAKDLDLEASGALFLDRRNSLLIASDDAQKGQSPLWELSLSDSSQKLKNIKMTGLEKIDDIESLSADERGNFYAMSSLSVDKKGKVVSDRNLIARFRMNADEAIFDRQLDLRTPLVESLKRHNLLRPILNKLEKDLDVESLAFEGLDGYIGLKSPQMPDGSSIILKISNLVTQIEQNSLAHVDVDVHAIVRLDDERCKSTARITDLIKLHGKMLVLGNCKKGEKSGQVWELSDRAVTPDLDLLFHVANGRVEGLALNGTTFYLTSDNGSSKGSDILRVKMAE